MAIPSVSRDADPETMQAAAQWLAARLTLLGGRVEPTGGHPVVRAEWLGDPGAPTVLVYGHYDVQPTGEDAEWAAPPFGLAVDGDVLRGRGVTDDKGPVYLVVKLLQALMARDGRLPLNVKLLVEGEEEIGSPHLPAYLEAHAEELAGDLVISADGAMWRTDRAVAVDRVEGPGHSVRRITGATTDLHSGRYGGTVANPAHALAEVLAGLHDASGAVAVSGFYEGIPPMADTRRAEIAAVGLDDAQYAQEPRRDRGVRRARVQHARTSLDRPTLEINGISAGGKYTVIPHQATGHVPAGWCRAGPGPGTAGRHRAPPGEGPRGVRLDVVQDPARVPAYTIRPDHPAIRAATAALEEVYPGQSVLLTAIGGTLPATTLFEEVLGAKTLFFSFSTADERLHAPNEFLRTRRVAEGIGRGDLPRRVARHRSHRLGVENECSPRRHDRPLRLLLLPHSRRRPPGTRPRAGVRPGAGLRRSPDRRGAATGRQAAARQRGDQPARPPRAVPGGHASTPPPTTVMGDSTPPSPGWPSQG